MTTKRTSPRFEAPREGQRGRLLLASLLVLGSATAAVGYWTLRPEPTLEARRGARAIPSAGSTAVEAASSQRAEKSGASRGTHSMAGRKLSPELARQLRSQWKKKQALADEEKRTNLEASATRLIDRAVVAGVWTEDDAVSLMGIHDEMSDEQVADTMGRLRELFLSGALDYVRTGGPDPRAAGLHELESEQ